MQNGWVSWNGITYYQDFESGIYTGERTISENSYLFEQDGTFLSGAYEVDGVSYFRNAYGYPETGIVDEIVPLKKVAESINKNVGVR